MPTHGDPSKWRAGKRLTAKTIVKTFPPHNIFVEPFAGRAYVFFHNDKLAPDGKAILNDKDCKVIRELKAEKCGLQDKGKCEKLKEAKVTCGYDWKRFLRHDGPKTLFYLDPPYENNATSDKYYRFKDVSLKEVLDGTRRLKGTVVLSYSPDRRGEICNRETGFHCRTLKTWSFANPSKELLAVKRAKNA